MSGTEAVLGRGEKMVAGQVIVELTLDNTLYYFGNNRKNRDGSKVGWIGGVAGFVDWMDDRMFPVVGEI